MCLLLSVAFSDTSGQNGSLVWVQSLCWSLRMSDRPTPDCRRVSDRFFSAFSRVIDSVSNASQSYKLWTHSPNSQFSKQTYAQLLLTLRVRQWFHFRSHQLTPELCMSAFFYWNHYQWPTETNGEQEQTDAMVVNSQCCRNAVGYLEAWKLTSSWTIVNPLHSWRALPQYGVCQF